MPALWAGQWNAGPKSGARDQISSAAGARFKSLLHRRNRGTSPVVAVLLGDYNHEFARPFGEVTEMPEHSKLLGLAAPIAALIAAAVVLPASALADHEGRYFGFGYQPYAAPAYPPPVVYPPPPRVRETAPGVYEYEVAPGHWVRMRSGYGYEPPRRSVRTPPPSRVARPQPAQPPAPTPVPKSKPDPMDEPSVTVRDAPAAITLGPVRQEPLREEPIRDEPMLEQTAPEIPEQTAARSPDQTDEGSGGGLSCEAAADIVETFGFSDVQSTSCSGDVYGFDASRDGSSYSIRVSAADGELTEVRRR
jgi:hypothetical protein